jgi:hypothetical protein
MYLVSSDLQAEVEWQGLDEHGSVYVKQISPEYPVSKNINILYDRSAWYNIEKAVMIVYSPWTRCSSMAMSDCFMNIFIDY